MSTISTCEVYVPHSTVQNISPEDLASFVKLYALAGACWLSVPLISWFVILPMVFGPLYGYLMMPMVIMTLLYLYVGLLRGRTYISTEAHEELDGIMLTYTFRPSRQMKRGFIAFAFGFSYVMVVVGTVAVKLLPA